MTQRDDVSHVVEDDGGLLYSVERSKSGSLTARVRVWGRVTIDGKDYEYDVDTVRCKLRRVKDSPAEGQKGTD
jgi:hypothetical protein